MEDRQAPEARQLMRAPLAEPIGVTGLRQYSGFIREEFLRQLEGLRGRAVFDEMSKNDSTCGAILFAIRQMMRSLPWSVEPSDPAEDRANEAKEMLEGMLFADMQHTWPDFIDSACSMFTYGFSLHEILWKRRAGHNPSKPWLSSDFDDGLWAPRAFAPRSQRTVLRWIFDEGEHLLAFEQTPMDRPAIVVPMNRCLHFRTTTEMDNPEGQSLLRTAYRAWYWLKRLQEIEGIGTERDLAGYPVLRVPGKMLDPNADLDMQKAKLAYEHFLRKVRRDENEGVLLPSDRDENGNLFYEFELMSPGGSRQLRIDESINRYQKDITRSVLADFIFLGSDSGSGSLALGSTKVSIFLEALKGYAHAITSEINEVVVPQIWRINGLDMDLMPRVTPGEVEVPDLAGLSAFVTALAGVGFDLATDTELENHLRSLADLPQAPDRTDDDDFFAMPSGRLVPRPENPDEGGGVSGAPAPESGAPAPERGAGAPERGSAGADRRETEDGLSKALRAAFDGEDARDWSGVLEGFEHGR